MATNGKTTRYRLDERVLELDLAPTLQRARALIMAGVVLVNDTPATKAGSKVALDAVIRLKAGSDDDYASRGAHKLAPALTAFQVDPADCICLDVGASTGGFTDVLLRRGAKRVYAVDVGYGQLAWKLRDDPRVVVLERTNARYLSDADIPERVDLIVVDVSFISVRLLVPVLAEHCRPGGILLLMVKPQFEVRKGQVGEGGVVRDESLRRETIRAVCDAALEVGFELLGERDNDIRGPKGNLETFVHLVRCHDETNSLP